MSHLPATEMMVAFLAVVETARSGHWLLTRVGDRIDARQDRRRTHLQEVARQRQAERAHLVDVGNVAKLGVLCNAGLVPDDVGPWAA